MESESNSNQYINHLSHLVQYRCLHT